MKSLKHIILALLATIIFSNCEIFIIHQPEPESKPPQLPSTQAFTIPLNKFDTVFGTENHLNYDIAAKQALNWKVFLQKFDQIINFYTICQQSNGQHFGGDTWYWQVFFHDSVFELYATSFTNNEVLIEAYINPQIDQGNSDSTNKVLEGYYFPEKQSGNFTFITKENRLTVNWVNDFIVYFSDDNSLNSDRKLLFQTGQNLYLYNYVSNNEQDTAYVQQSISENWGKIKYYSAFGNNNWHCWDNDLENTDCDDTND